MSIAEEASRADLLLLNGRIVTVDPDFRMVEAVAVLEGRILAVGRSDELKVLVGDGTEVIDLKGKMVLPGLIDSHLHMLSTGVALTQINCRTPPMRSISDLIAAVRERASEAEHGEWIQGRGWDQVKLAEHRNPTRWDLDEVAPDNPVILTRTCGHVVVVNSKALEIAGIDRDTPQPMGGIIVKRDDGEPTGLLKESPAYIQVKKHIPPRGLEENAKAIRLASKTFSEAGLTSVIEAGIELLEMQAYQKVAEEEGLTVRVNVMLRGRLRSREESVEESVQRIRDFTMRTGYGNDLLRFLGLKLLIDGGIGGRTALLREPYEDEPNNYGILTMPEEDLQRRVDAGNLAGMMVGVHCAGGKAMDIVLKAFEETDKLKPIKGRRYSIIHAYQPSEENFKACRRLGITVASQPSFLYYLGESFYENVGRERSSWLKPHRAWIDEGIVVASGTDSPVTPYHPFPSLWASIARRTEINDVQVGTEQCITREEAIRFYTINGAYLTFEEDIKGSIEPGKLVDMIVIDRDILTCPLDDIKDTRVLRTILGGKTVFEAQA
ncbi:MAG: amidohydrolase [Candidatus Bathyarchaeota archaeon]|nr:MAG: amidohydrolase [Candidatus Bathyarchaeota archaeon]